MNRDGAGSYIFPCPFQAQAQLHLGALLHTCCENQFDTNYLGINAVLGPVMVTPLRAGLGPNRAICRSGENNLRKIKIKKS